MMSIFRQAAICLALCFAATSAQAQSSCTLPANASGFIQDVGRALNQERARFGLPPLRQNRMVSQAAATHACDMQRNGFFGHQGSDGTTAFERVKRLGTSPCRVAENVAFGYANAQIVVQGWMDSPGHRRNMLQADVSEFGVGVAEAPGGPYAVLVFYRPC